MTLCLSMALSSVLGAIGRSSRPQEGGGIAQAWTMRSEVASVPNGTI